jgi:hypothetical protein
MVVTAGFIIGFDDETSSVSKAMIDSIKSTSIPVCMIGLLTALPNTQLTRRLQKEGRLFRDYEIVKDASLGCQCTMGLNFCTLRPRRDIIDDYQRVLQSVYDVETYFERIRTVGRALNCFDIRRRSPFSTRELVKFSRLIWHMGIRTPSLRRHFWRTFIDCVWHNPRAIDQVIRLMALYLHLGRFSLYVIGELSSLKNRIDAGEWNAPPIIMPLPAVG